MDIKRCAALLLIAVTVLCTMRVPAEAAAAGGLAGINYKRIFVSDQGNSFPATISFGGVKLKGSLQWTGKLEGEELDGYIEDFLDELDVDLEDVQKCQQELNEYYEMLDFSAYDAEQTALRIAGVVGNGLYAAVLVDAGKQVMNGEWSFTDKEQWANVLSNFSTPYKAADTVISEILGYSPLGKSPVFKTIMTLKSAAQASYETFFEDVDRWETRVNGMIAMRTLEEFYSQLNKYLEDKEPSKAAQWVLKFNGKKTRIFRFMGVYGNLQKWEVCIDLVKTVDYANDHNSPAERYEGPASIELKHDMSAFSDAMWNLKLGSLKKDWYDNCEYMYIGGEKVFKCSNSGGIDVYRFLCEPYARVDIFTDRLANGMYLGSSGIVTARLDYGGFDDYQTVYSDRKASAMTATGFTNSDSDTVVGYVIADVSYHVEGNADRALTIVQDKGSAQVGLLFNEASVNDGTKEILTFWDDNIWNPLKTKQADIVIRTR